MLCYKALRSCINGLGGTYTYSDLPAGVEEEALDDLGRVIRSRIEAVILRGKKRLLWATK